MGMENSLDSVRRFVWDRRLRLAVVDGSTSVAAGSQSDALLCADPMDTGAVLAALADSGITSVKGVISLGCDNPPVISSLCRKFGCTGLDEETARNCTEKDRRIELLRNGGIPTPSYILASDEAGALRGIRTIGFPSVIKPVDGTGSACVFKLRGREDALPLIRRCFESSRAGRIVIEEFLEGSEHTVTGFSLDEGIVITGFSDRDYRDKDRFFPSFFESGDIFPTRLGDVMVRKTERVLAGAVKALGLRRTFFSSDILVSPDGEVFVLELTGRLTGARIATEIVPLGNGIDPLPNIIRLALGLDPVVSELKPTRNRAVVQQYLPSTGGIVEWVGDIGDIRLPGNVYDLYWNRRPEPGMRLPVYSMASDILAGAIAYGDTIESAERSAKDALLSLPLRIETAIAPV